MVLQRGSWGPTWTCRKPTWIYRKLRWSRPLQSSKKKRPSSRSTSLALKTFRRSVWVYVQKCLRNSVRLNVLQSMPCKSATSQSEIFQNVAMERHSMRHQSIALQLRRVWLRTSFSRSTGSIFQPWGMMAGRTQ